MPQCASRAVRCRWHKHDPLIRPAEPRHQGCYNLDNAGLISGGFCHANTPGFNTEPGWTPEPILLGTLLGQEVLHVCRGIRQTVPVDHIAADFVTLELPTKPREDGSGSRPATAPFNLTVARLGGDVGFVGLGGEVLTEIGMAIKAGSPCRHTFVVTHCNGAAGYLAPKEAHVQGGYEVHTSPFAPQAAEIVVRESIRLLHALRSNP